MKRITWIIFWFCVGLILQPVEVHGSAELGRKQILNIDLEELILYWKDYRTNKGLGFEDLEKVNNTILQLEDYRNLLKQGAERAKGKEAKVERKCRKR